MERAARTLGVQPQLLDVRGADEVEHALAVLTREPANALTVPPFPILFAQRQRILDFTAQSRLSVMATDQREWIEGGTLLFYGASITTNIRRAAANVDKILNGANAVDSPSGSPRHLS
jgi:putative tryptophan/tyrosine transport system substrate-binding protein